MNRDLSSFPRLTCGFDAPAVIFHDALADGRPRPKPMRFFAVKKDSKILGKSCGSMPLPMSLISMTPVAAPSMGDSIFSVDPEVAATRHRGNGVELEID